MKITAQEPRFAACEASGPFVSRVGVMRVEGFGALGMDGFGVEDDVGI